jgi:dsDNA-specific endonuclease/ATPase MutS2
VCAKNPPIGGRVFYRLVLVIAKHDHVPPEDANEPVAIPITGELDLHTFRPADISNLLDDYFAEGRRRGLFRVRVVHGKGTGTLLMTVHAHLQRSAAVAGFAAGDETSGGWGATIVTLKPDNS